MALPYRNARGLDLRSLVALLCAGVGLALILGMLWYRLGDFGGRILVRSVLPALAVGALMHLVIHKLAIAHHRLVIAVAATSVLIFSAVDFYGDYRRARTQEILDIEDGMQFSLSMGADPEDLMRRRDERVSELSFSWYWRRNFGLNAHAIDGPARTFGPTLGMAFFFLELLAACFVACYYPAGKASEPVCQHCGEWSIERELATCAYGSLAALRAALLQEDAGSLRDAMVPRDTEEFVELHLAHCPKGHDKDAGVLRIREHFFDRRSRSLLVRHRMDLSLTSAEQTSLSDIAEEWKSA